MDIPVSISTLKVHEARRQLSLRRLMLTVTGKIAMLGAGFSLPLYTPPFFSTLTTVTSIRDGGDRGDL